MNDQSKDEIRNAISHDILLDPTKLDEDLDRLYGVVVEKASNAIAYYQGRKTPKRFWARLIRLSAVILFSLAGLIPLLWATVTGFFDGAPLVIPENPNADEIKEFIQQNLTTGVDSGRLGLLVAAVAAALIGMDKFLGLSSSWARYISAELSLHRNLDRFQMDWALANAALNDGDAERHRPIERLQLLKDFSMEISRINEDETKVWISEYQSALAALEKFAKEREEAMHPGSIQVNIQRGAEVQGVVKVLIDGQKLQETGGDSVAVRRVPPGAHEVQVIGADVAGQEVNVSQMVTVPSDGVAPVTLKLS